jgi:starch phosphorylase
VHIDHVDLDMEVAEVGSEHEAQAVVALGDLAVDDVEVQLLHGPSGQGNDLAAPAVVSMTPAGDADDGHLRFSAKFRCAQTGRYGVTVRVVPAHPHLVHPVELGCVAWPN